MQRGAKFSLAAALFGWPPAPGHTAPESAVPDAWVLLFRDQHARTDPAVLSGIFTACPAGRDCALQWAPKVTLTVDTTAQDEPHSAWVQRTRVLQRILSARPRPAASAGPTQAAGLCLRVTLDDSAHSGEAYSALSTLMCEDSSAVTELYATDTSSQRPITPMFRSLLHPSAVCPNLTTLTLESCDCTAPAPATVPNLRQFTFTADKSPSGLMVTAITLETLAPLLPQLTHLTLQCSGHRPLWGCLSYNLEADHVASVLTHFSTDAHLNDQLIELIVTHAPAVTDLSVSRPWAVLNRSHRVWGVERLRLEADAREYEMDAHVVHLPRSRNGQTTITANHVLFKVYEDHGLDPVLVARLPEWQFNTTELRLDTSGDLPSEDYTAALTSTLRQVSEGLHVTGPVQLSLTQWDFDTDRLRVLFRARPALLERGLHAKLVIEDWLTDEHLSVFVESHAEPLPSLAAERVSVHSDDHAHAPWPWDECCLERLYVADLRRLPNPAGHGAPRKVSCEDLSITSGLSQEEHTELTSRLQHVRWGVVPSKEGWTITMFSPRDKGGQEESLRTQLAVLSAVQFESAEAEHQCTLTLYHWCLTRQVIELLQGLPHWQCRLTFHQCTWPEKDSTGFVLLGRSVPSTYRI